MTDPSDAPADVDALVARVSPGLTGPVVEQGDVVLVTGPWLSGASSVAAVLRERLPERVFVEADGLSPGQAPVAVVFVVSAAAPLADSDCALLDSAAADTDLVIGAVSKTDVHRTWRDVLDADRTALAAHAPRYRRVPWVGVAAAPDLGAPRVDDLVAAVRDGVAAPGLGRRNRLRAWISRLTAGASRYNREVDGVGRQARVNALRAQRTESLRLRRVAKSERTIALRSQVQQARVQLSYFARNRCTSVRAELQEDAATITRRQLPAFEGYVRSRVDAVVSEVDQGVTHHLAGVVQELGLPPLGAPVAAPAHVDFSGPPLKSRRLERRLMMLLGAGFGLGVALTLSRLFADLAPGLTIAGSVACALVGLAVTVWVVGMRGLLHDRAVLDRWIAEVTASLRSAVEERVATRVLAAESALAAAVSERDAADGATVDDEVAVVDRELREHALARARAVAVRDREVPAIERALEAVRAELGEQGSNGHAVAGGDEVSVARGAESNEE